MNNTAAKALRKALDNLAQPIIAAEHLNPHQKASALNTLEKKLKKAYREMNWIQKTEFRANV